MPAGSVGVAVRFTVTADGHTVGRPIGRVGFMAIRDHRTSPWDLD